MADRSAALQRLKQWAAGVRDVDRALKVTVCRLQWARPGLNILLQAGYPGDKQFKLLERKGQMLFELGKYDEAKDCFLKAKKMVKNSTTSESGN